LQRENIRFQKQVPAGWAASCPPYPLIPFATEKYPISKTSPRMVGSKLSTLPLVILSLVFCHFDRFICHFERSEKSYRPMQRFLPSVEMTNETVEMTNETVEMTNETVEMTRPAQAFQNGRAESVCLQPGLPVSEIFISAIFYAPPASLSVSGIV
jgi:hypothetical protein